MEGVTRHALPDGTPACILTVRKGGLVMACEFVGERVPWRTRIGHEIDVRSDGARAEGAPGRVLLLDCVVTGAFIEPED